MFYTWPQFLMTIETKTMLEVTGCELPIPTKDLEITLGRLSEYWAKNATLTECHDYMLLHCWELYTHLRDDR